MKISIITVTFNSGLTLCHTLDSVLQQTYSDIEYIIVDGASKDNTLEIIKEYGSRFPRQIRWISEKDKGIYDAMNKGLRICTGDVIGILNSDDILMDPNVLADIAYNFDEDTDAIFGNLCFVKHDNLNQIVRIWKGSSYKKFETGWHPAHPTFYVRREVYEKYGIFDTSFDVSADFELMLRFIEKNRIKTKYLDRYMVKMRMGGESTKSVRNIIKGNKNILYAFKKNGIPVSFFYPLKRLFPKFLSMVRFKISTLKSANFKINLYIVS